MKACIYTVRTRKIKGHMCLPVGGSSEATPAIKPICFQSGQTSCAAMPPSFQQQTLIIVLSLSSKDTSIAQPHWLASKSRRRLCQAIPSPPLHFFCFFAITTKQQKKTSRQGGPTVYVLHSALFCLFVRASRCETFHVRSGRDFKKNQKPHIISWLERV